jgi:hypothetical protein
MSRRKELKRLTFQQYALWRKAHYIGRAYVSKNTGIEFWITPQIDMSKLGQRGRWGHAYYLWTLYRGNRKLGVFSALADAQMAAQRDWEGLNWHWLEKQEEEETGRVFRPRLANV